MRRFLFIVLLMVPVLSYVAAQEPTTTWPYIFKDFTEATVYMSKGGKIEYKANVHLAKSTLHYIADDMINEVRGRDILLVDFGGRKFMNVNNSLMEVVEEVEGGFIAMLREINFTELNETGGAYGSSSATTSTKALSSLEGIGSITTHMLQQDNKNSGKVLPLQSSYYIVTEGRVYPANKSMIEDFLPVDKKAAFKAFVKQNKIKWNNPQSLIKLVEVL